MRVFSLYLGEKLPPCLDIGTGKRDKVFAYRSAVSGRKRIF